MVCICFSLTLLYSYYLVLFTDRAIVICFPIVHFSQATMAEIAGLAIGGVSVVALVNAAMSALDKIEAAKAYGKDYQQSALRVSLLRLRLSRCPQSIQNASNGQSFGTPEDYDSVKTSLESIAEDIIRTEKDTLDQANEDGDDTPAPLQDDKELDSIGKLIEKVNTMTLQRQNRIASSHENGGTIRNEQNLNDLIIDIAKHLTKLEQVFPSKQQDQSVEQLVDADAEELIKAAEVDEVYNGGDASESMKILAEVTAAVDSPLNQALQQVLGRTPPDSDVRGHIFQVVVEATENSKIEIGDYVADGAQIVGPGGFYGGTIESSGNARVRLGNSYGGMDPLKE